MNLQNNTLLQGGKYRIVGVLGQGGFGITYLAEQPMLERKVCIKEFFFKDYCERDESSSHVTLSTKSNKDLVERFRKKFLKEARVISKFHHDHIVQVLDIFEENNTAYYVMDYIEGESLREMIDRVGFLPEQKAIEYIKEVASALSYIHAKSINHLDVKPGNIMLRREDQRLLLIDFGVSKQYDDATYEGTTTTPVGISHGYSPAEQYLRHGVQSFSPQSDVYALAATLYKLLTGVTPPEAIVVQEEGLPLAPLRSRNISSRTITAIENAMKSRTQRTQSVDAFVADLDASEEVTVVGVTETEPEPIVEKTELRPDPIKQPLKVGTSDNRSHSKLIKWIIAGWTVVVAIYFIFVREVPVEDDNIIANSNESFLVENIVSETNNANNIQASDTSHQLITTQNNYVSTEDVIAEEGKLHYPTAPTSITVKNRTIRDLLYFPYGCLQKEIDTKEKAQEALTSYFGSYEVINVFSIGLHRNKHYDYCYKGVPIGVSYITWSENHNWFNFYLNTKAEADKFYETLVEDIISAGIPMAKDPIYGGFSNRNPVSIFEWVFVSPVRKIKKEVDNSNIDISEHVGKYRVEFGIYKRTIVESTFESSGLY